MRLFGRRLRRYILAYFAIEKAKEKQVNTDATTQSDQDDNEILDVPTAGKNIGLAPIRSTNF